MLLPQWQQWEGCKSFVLFIFFFFPEVGGLGDPVAVDRAWLFSSTAGNGGNIPLVATGESRAPCTTREGDPRAGASVLCS